MIKKYKSGTVLFFGREEDIEVAKLFIKENGWTNEDVSLRKNKDGEIVVVKK